MKYLWYQFLHRLAKRLNLYGTLDSEKALREKNLEILRLKQELEQRQGFSVVYIDPAIRQKGYQQSAWNAERERNTDKPRIIPNTHGQYFQHRRKEFVTTELLPTIEKNDAFLL